jgi:hypothetical protein
MTKKLFGFAAAGIVGLAVSGALAWSLLAPASAEASPDYTGYHAYTDATDSTFFAFTLDSMTAPSGMAEFGIVGQGVIVMPTPTFAFDSSHQIHVGYDGTGTLESDATLDLDFGLAKPGTQSQSVPARLIANIDTNKETANVEFWLNGRHYKAQGGRPTESPDHAMAALAMAMQKGDWGSVYDQAAPVWQSYMGRSQFISQWNSGWQAQFGTGSVTVQLLDAPQLNDTGLGFWTAYADLSISSPKASATYRLMLQNTGGGWQLFDLQQK